MIQVFVIVASLLFEKGVPGEFVQAIGGTLAVETVSGRIAIPFHFRPGDGVSSIDRVVLFVSRDFGRHWAKAAEADPADGWFVYKTDREGLHWFAVQLLGKDGSAHPKADEVRPALKTFITIKKKRPTAFSILGRSWESRSMAS